MAYRLLDTWKGIPGLQDDGSVNAADFRTWIAESRTQLIATNRIDVGDTILGQALGCSPADPDGCWPGAIVRSIIEELQSECFEDGLSNGRSKSLGFSDRESLEGGAKEHELAAQYQQWAEKIAMESPRTAAFLLALARSHVHVGKQEDRERDQQLDNFS